MSPRWLPSNSGPAAPGGRRPNSISANCNFPGSAPDRSHGNRYDAHIALQPTAEHDDGGLPDDGRSVSKREARRRATDRALRVAAIRLITERGYDATSTADIAMAAGVTQRTFFNHFPTKEAVVLLPADLLANVAAESLRSRPLGEDLPRSLAAASMVTARSLAAVAVAGAEDRDERRELMLGIVRLMFTEPAVRKVFLERRAVLEDLIWEIVIERGGSPDDLEARSTIATVVALNYLAMRIWAESGGVESIPAVWARCMLTAPDPARFAAGIVDADA
jgi:AcrR family transcriptional regulator